MGNPTLMVGLLINGVAYAAIFIVIALLIRRFTNAAVWRVFVVGSRATQGPQEARLASPSRIITSHLAKREGKRDRFSVSRRFAVAILAEKIRGG